MNIWEEVKRILDHEIDLSICSAPFFNRYCSQDAFSLSEKNELQDVLDELYPEQRLHGVYITTENLGAVLSIQHEDKESERDFIWGFIGWDHFQRPSLIPKADYKLEFKGEYNLGKIQRKVKKMSEYRVASFNRYMRSTVKPLMGKWMEFDWASDSEMNFTLNYDEPKTKDDGTVVSAMMWYPEITDNEMRLVKSLGETKPKNRSEYKNANAE